jgi:DNA-binding response OmpR family regulator
VAVVVDDDEAIRELLAHVLRKAGFAVVAAADGRSGIDAVHRYDPALVTLDLDLPGQDGFAVTREIRRLSDAPILMISGNGDEIDVVQSLNAGADAYVVKPFRPRELRARIEALVRRAERVRAAAPAPAAAVPAPRPSDDGGPASWVREAMADIAPAAEWRPGPVGPAGDPVWRRTPPPVRTWAPQDPWRADGGM